MGVKITKGLRNNESIQFSSRVSYILLVMICS